MSGPFPTLRGNGTPCRNGQAGKEWLDNPVIAHRQLVMGNGPQLRPFRLGVADTTNARYPEQFCQCPRIPNMPQEWRRSTDAAAARTHDTSSARARRSAPVLEPSRPAGRSQATSTRTRRSPSSCWQCCGSLRTWWRPLRRRRFDMSTSSHQRAHLGRSRLAGRAAGLPGRARPAHRAGAPGPGARSAERSELAVDAGGPAR